MLESISRVCFALVGRDRDHARRERSRHRHRCRALHLDDRGSDGLPHARRRIGGAANGISLRRRSPLDEADAALAGPGAEGATGGIARRAPVAAARRHASRRAVAGIMLSEQALLNAFGADGRRDRAPNVALAGIVFNVMLIARAPLQALPGDPDLAAAAPDGARGDRRPRRVRQGDPRHADRDPRPSPVPSRSGLLAIGPFVLDHVFGQQYHYSRDRARLDRDRNGLSPAPAARSTRPLWRATGARPPASAGFCAAVMFLAWMFAPIVSEQLLRAEIGYALATAAARDDALHALPLVVRPRHAASLAPAPAAPQLGDRPRRGPPRQKIAEPATNRFAPAARQPGAVSASMPPSTWIAPPSPTAARDRGDLRRSEPLDELLPAPAGLDCHAEREVDRAGHLGQRARRGCRG